MFSKFKKLISLFFATFLLTSISNTSIAADKLHFVIGGGAGVVGMELLEEPVKL